MKDLNIFDKINVIQEYGLDLDKAIIYVGGELDASLSTALRLKYAVLKTYYDSIKTPLKEITIVLNSPGGDATVITSVIDWYAQLKQNENILINVHAEGTCSSAATFILGGATGKRTASKRTRFMVHEIQITGVEGTRTQTKAFTTETDFLADTCYGLYADFTFARNEEPPSKLEHEKCVALWTKRCEKETYFGAIEAKEWGLIDDII